MAQPCSICRHESRLTLEKRCLEGATYTSLSREYKVSAESLSKHMAEHVPKRLIQAVKQKELTEDLNLIERIDLLLQRSEQIFERNFLAKKDSIALAALNEQRNVYELIARISAALHAAELLRSSEDREEEAQKSGEEFSRKLKILTDEDLEVYEALSCKVHFQEDKPVISKSYQFLGGSDRFQSETDTK